MVRRAEGQIEKPTCEGVGFFESESSTQYLQSTQFFRIRQGVRPTHATIGSAWERLEIKFLAFGKRHKCNPHTGRAFCVFVVYVNSLYDLPIIVGNYPAVHKQVKNTRHPVVAIPAYLVAVPKLKAQRIRPSVKRLRVLLPHVEGCGLVPIGVSLIRERSPRPTIYNAGVLLARGFEGYVDNHLRQSPTSKKIAPKSKTSRTKANVIIQSP